MKMKKRNKLILIVLGIVLLVLSVWFIARGAKTMNVKSVTYTSFIADPAKIEKTVITPNTVSIYITYPDEPFSNTPDYEWLISDQEWDNIVSALKFYGFMSLPEVINGRFMYDGPGFFVEVQTSQTVHTAGGNNAGDGFFGGNWRFAKICKAIKENIPS